MNREQFHKIGDMIDKHEFLSKVVEDFNSEFVPHDIGLVKVYNSTSDFEVDGLTNFKIRSKHNHILDATRRVFLSLVKKEIDCLRIEIRKHIKDFGEK